MAKPFYAVMRAAICSHRRASAACARLAWDGGKARARGHCCSTTASRPHRRWRQQASCGFLQAEAYYDCISAQYRHPGSQGLQGVVDLWMGRLSVRPASADNACGRRGAMRPRRARRPRRAWRRAIQRRPRLGGPRIGRAWAGRAGFGRAGFGRAWAGRAGLRRVGAGRAGQHGWRPHARPFVCRLRVSRQAGALVGVVCAAQIVAQGSAGARAAGAGAGVGGAPHDGKVVDHPDVAFKDDGNLQGKGPRPRQGGSGRALYVVCFKQDMHMHMHGACAVACCAASACTSGSGDSDIKGCRAVTQHPCARGPPCPHTAQ